MIRQMSFLPGTFIVIRLVVSFQPVKGWPDKLPFAVTLNTECFKNWLEIELELVKAADKTAKEYGRELMYWDYADTSEVIKLKEQFYGNGGTK